jgi:hypothetical protein
MPTYDATCFRGTHNSYSGGARGSIVDQLHAGVRLLELDVHAQGFAALRDFRVGHLKPGAEVALGDGNPATIMLSDWLTVIARWSNENVHAPITLVLDLKDDLISTDCGGPEDLNECLEKAFGDLLYTRDERDRDGEWPDIADLHNRVLCVLSGNGNTRASYRWTCGAEPALSVNARGDVVLVYRSTAGDLNGYLGAIGPDGVVEWQHKSTYCFSRMPLSRPAVSVNDDGWVLAAHEFQPPEGFVGSRLESVLGRIMQARRVTWFDSEVFAQGGAPWLELKGSEVRAVVAGTGGFRSITGSLDTGKLDVDWGKDASAPAAPPPADRAAWQGAAYRCAADATGAVVFGPEGGELLPVRFRQVAFVEEQLGDLQGSVRDALFFAADAKNTRALQAARQRGQVVRAWGFEECDAPGCSQIDATDDPRATWYAQLTNAFPA